MVKPARVTSSAFKTHLAVFVLQASKELTANRVRWILSLILRIKENILSVAESVLMLSLNTLNKFLFIIFVCVKKYVFVV